MDNSFSLNQSLKGENADFYRILNLLQKIKYLIMRITLVIKYSDRIIFTEEMVETILGHYWCMIYFLVYLGQISMYLFIVCFHVVKKRYHF